MAIKAQALALVGAAAATAYWTDFVHLLLEDPRVHRCVDLASAVRVAPEMEGSRRHRSPCKSTARDHTTITHHHHPPTHSGYFRLACLCLGVDTAITAYRMLWFHRRKGSGGGQDVYAIHHPQLLPAAIAAGVLGAFFLVRSLWPVWGFLAPLILLVVLTGLVFSLHFVPWPFQ